MSRSKRKTTKVSVEPAKATQSPKANDDGLERLGLAENSYEKWKRERDEANARLRSECPRPEGEVTEDDVSSLYILPTICFDPGRGADGIQGLPLWDEEVNFAVAATLFAVNRPLQHVITHGPELMEIRAWRKQHRKEAGERNRNADKAA